MLSNSYKHENSMVSHFYNRGEEVPIWGIFEIMMLINFLKEYEECINDLYQELPLPIYNKIVATGIKGKLQKLNAYIKN